MIVTFYIIIIVFSVIQSATVKWFNRTSSNSLVFNVIKTLSALIFFGAISIWKFKFNLNTMLYGSLYGIFLCISMYCGYKALSLGPMSLTSLIVSFSVVFPLIYGIVFCNEEITAVKLAGFVFLTFAIVSANLSSNAFNKTGKMNRYNFKWELFVLATFVCNGLCSILQKMHQISYPGQYCSEFMLFAMLLCGTVFLTAGLMKMKPKVHMTIKGKKYAVLSGIANAAANYSTIALAGYENASIMYPAVSAGTILATVVFGTVVFKEKLKCNQMIAMLCGIISVICLKM